MSSTIGNVPQFARSIVQSPFSGLVSAARTASPQAQDLLRTLLGSGFDPRGAGAAMFQAGAQQLLLNPAAALASLAQQGALQTLPSFPQRPLSPFANAQIGQQFATAGGSVAANAGVIPTGLNPAGNSNTDLVNTIAGAPLFSPDEAALMKNLPPEQQAMMTLQAKKQRESLMTSILTNITNMKHESLKGIANNLRG